MSEETIRIARKDFEALCEIFIDLLKSRSTLDAVIGRHRNLIVQTQAMMEKIEIIKD